jgi:GH24 family phage-related lysozyme (muramidase)
MTAAAALSLLGSLLKNLDTASLTLGDLSVSPFGVTVPVPRRVQRKTTVGEWVTRPIRTFVQVTRTVWKTITEAVPRFIMRTRQVIDRIVRSEWVTTFKQVAKTFWEKVTEKVPLLGWLGKVIGFIWKTVIKPVIRWVTEAIRTLRTWVENIIRWVTQKIQDGWNYITRQISETIRAWVEKTDWVREWVTKEITVWETVWEQKFVAFPIPSGSGGLLAALTPQTWSNLLRTLGAGTALATLAATFSFCDPAASDPCPTPTPDATGTTIAHLQTQAVSTVFTEAAQTAVAAGTPTFIPMTATTSATDYVNIWNTNTGASDAIVDNIIAWEGNKEFPYDDSTNNCTIGIGHKLHYGPCSLEEKATKYSPEQIQEWFKQDLADAERSVRAMFQTLDNEYRPNQPEGNPFPITQAQFDALVSFTFNAGPGNLTKLVRDTIQPDSATFNYEEFSHLMLEWYSQGGPGLLPRRQAEVDLFINGTYP